MEYFHALMLVVGFLLITYVLFCIIGDVASWWALLTRKDGDLE